MKGTYKSKTVINNKVTGKTTNLNFSYHSIGYEGENNVNV